MRHSRKIGPSKVFRNLAHACGAAPGVESQPHALPCPLQPQRGRPTGSWSQSVALAVAFSDAAPAAPASARTATATAAAARTATGAADRRTGIVAARRAGGLAAGRSTSMFANSFVFVFVRILDRLSMRITSTRGRKNGARTGWGRRAGAAPSGRFRRVRHQSPPSCPANPRVRETGLSAIDVSSWGRPLLRVGGGAGAGAPRRAVPDYGYVRRRGRPTNAATSWQCSDRLKRSSAYSAKSNPPTLTSTPTSAPA